MVRALAFAVLLSGCSLLFNPNNTPFECAMGLPTPASLDAIAGSGNDVTLQWPQVSDAGGVARYRVCFGFDPMSTTTCRDLEVSTGFCDGGLCSATVDGADAGFAYNQRVFFTLQSEDDCKNVSSLASALKVSTTPINGDFKTLDGLSLSTTCDAGFRIDGGEGLVFEAQVPALSLCISVLTLGDDQWQDSTIEVETQVSGQTFGGVLQRAAPTAMGPRTAVIFTSYLPATSGLALTTRQGTVDDLPVATSVARFLDGDWVSMRVATQGETVSVSTAPPAMPFTEAVRWSGPQGTAGQLGLVLVGGDLPSISIRAGFRALRVHTLATIPDGGPTAASWSFLGTHALDGIRQSQTGAVLASCPAYTAGCADCAPSSSGCLQIDGAGSSAFASFDVPVGIDETQPWSLKFKFAAALAMPANSPGILRTNIAPIVQNCCNSFSGEPLLDVSGGLGWSNSLRAFGLDSDPLGGSITPGVWNAFELHFDPFVGTSSIRWNDTLGRDGGYPGMLGPHLGALTFGGQNELHGFFTDVEISQP